MVPNFSHRVLRIPLKNTTNGDDFGWEGVVANLQKISSSGLFANLAIVKTWVENIFSKVMQDIDFKTEQTRGCM